MWGRDRGALSYYPEWLVSSYRDTPIGEALMRINDSKELSETDREAEVARLFAENGVTVTFED